MKLLAPALEHAFVSRILDHRVFDGVAAVRRVAPAENQLAVDQLLQRLFEFVVTQWLISESPLRVAEHVIYLGYPG